MGDCNVMSKEPQQATMTLTFKRQRRITGQHKSIDDVHKGMIPDIFIDDAMDAPALGARVECAPLQTDDQHDAETANVLSTPPKKRKLLPSYVVDHYLQVDAEALLVEDSGISGNTTPAAPESKK
jgi:hypothetical protein